MLLYSIIVRPETSETSFKIILYCMHDKVDYVIHSLECDQTYMVHSKLLCTCPAAGICIGALAVHQVWSHYKLCMT